MQQNGWPAWLYSGGFDQAVSQWSSERHTVLLGRMLYARKCVVDSDDEEEMTLPTDATTCVAVLRMRFGEMVEEDVRTHWRTSNDKSNTRTLRMDEPTRALYCSISLAAAVWTSTHAEYLLIKRGERGDGADCHVDGPSLHLVPSEFTDAQLGEFITSVASVSECGNGAKRTHVVYQLLHRSLNTANRGWGSASAQLLNLKSAQGAAMREIVLEAALVVLTGLHSCIDPPDRAGWRERLLIHHAFRRRLNVTELAANAPNLVKQIIRRLFLSTYSGNEPARTVHNNRRRTEGAFASAPSSLAPRRCRLTMAAIARRAATKNVRLEEIEAEAKLIDSRMWMGSEEWPWNGKAGATYTPIMLKPVALSTYMQAHVDNFESFWTVCYRNQIRISRFDSIQFDVFCELNEAMQATKDRTDMVRLAMKMPYAHCLSLQQAFALFGQHVTVTNTSYAQQLKTSPHYSSMLALARASAYLEQLVVYECCERIRTLQEIAVYERYVGSSCGLDHETIRTAVEGLPEHAAKLCVCTECHRVANAHIVRTAKNVAAFSEIGISSCIACANDASDVRCAKRISAAIRTAATAEHSASQNAIDKLDSRWHIDFDACMQTPLSRLEAGHLRRDARRTYEQHRSATACGENQLLRVPLLGKLVRIYGTWYTLCCYCGGLIHNVNARTNVQGLPACMRCSNLKFTKKEKKVEVESEHICRFCHMKKPDLVAYFSPYDDKFENEHVPPELRVTFWCSKHRPPWLKEALLVGLYDDVAPISIGEILARITDHSTPRV